MEGMKDRESRASSTLSRFQMKIKNLIGSCEYCLSESRLTQISQIARRSGGMKGTTTILGLQTPPPTIPLISRGTQH